MKYHSGEIELQNAVGMRKQADRIANMIRSYIPSPALAFLQRNPYTVIGGKDKQGRVWASPMSGEMQAKDDRHLVFTKPLLAHDPLANAFDVGGHIGLLMIEFSTRRRMRVNGRVEQIEGDTLHLETHQVYSNCNQHITRREVEHPQEKESPANFSSPNLSASQRNLIQQANTMFIASLHPEGGADASHRGGPEGFVHVLDENRIRIPDYSGNLMFNTLGNILVNPAVGLLFLDFETGRTLQITGMAFINQDPELLADFESAQNLIDFQITQVFES